MKKQSWRKQIIPKRKDVQDALIAVREVHECPICNEYLKKIKQCKEKGHK